MRKAKDVMRSPAITIHQDATVPELTEVLQTEHVSGVIVVDDDGRVVGVVTEKDVLYGSMGVVDDRGTGGGAETKPRVVDIMTSPAVCATEDTALDEVCRMLWKFHIHRVPVVQDGRAVGIVAAMDLVRAVAEGDIKV